MWKSLKNIYSRIKFIIEYIQVIKTLIFIGL